ncbi:tRNA (adenosine(37)-N6)-threonylcarbamoyltransferase complex dimerization subunit type 1 TsaB [Candidatus Marinamargulisbacteria bacterium SCGC AAA071-K20]|nr:tRNA (adenosine(37)-N6)-threonylcarbamoyltransferase complex dimerization subunit type 1 TsaB [Candidatus Marinamargulisbacteria bacterium SCGC AAA071-K20]
MELGVNLAVEDFSIALTEEGSHVASMSLAKAYLFSENLMHYIDLLCTNVGKSYTDIKAIGVVNGPGSYTGLRLSVAQCKTIASILNCPLYGIDTFDVILDQAPKLTSLIAVIIPARKREVNLKLAKTIDCPEWLTDEFMSVKYDKLEQFFLDFSEPITVVGALDGIDSISGKHTLLPASVSAEFVSKRAYRYLEQGEKGNYLKVLPKYSHQAV